MQKLSQQVVALCRQAGAATAQHDFPKALESLNNALTLSPAHPELLLQRATVFWRAQDYSSALADCQQIAREHPESEGAYRAEKLAAIIHQHAGNIDAALALYQKLVENHASDPEIFQARAELRFSCKQFSDAEADFSEALARDPTSEELLLRRAQTYMKLHQVERALADLNLALELHPDSSRAFYARALVHLKCQEPEKAVVDLRQTVQREPEFVPAWRRLLEWAEQHHNWDTVINTCSTLLALPQLKSRSELLRRRGLAYASAHQPELAILDFTDYLQRHDEVNIYFNRGLASMQLENYQAAYRDFDHVLEQQKTDTAALIQRAFCAYELSDYPRAYQDLSRVLEQDRASDIHWHLRAKVLVKMGRYHEAFEDITQALLRHENHGPYLELRGWLHTQLKKTAEALIDYERALQLDPENIPTKNRLAWILATTSHTEIRKGHRAIELANEVNYATQFCQPHYLDTLAAAHASVGEFEWATNFLNRAIQLVPPDDRVEFLQRLELYKAGLPFVLDD